LKASFHDATRWRLNAQEIIAVLLDPILICKSDDAGGTDVSGYQRGNLLGFISIIKLSDGQSFKGLQSVVGKEGSIYERFETWMIRIVPCPIIYTILALVIRVQDVEALIVRENS
jgi:hypothetical protein